MASTRLVMLVGLMLLAGVLSMTGCSKNGKPSGNADTNVESVKIDGRVFHLELALDGATRFKGLSDREFIEPDGGMLFVFPRASDQRFVMRDCPIDIDIIFLDPSGRITAMHHMPAEPPRDPETEPETGVPSTDKYEQRLKRYPSRYPAQFVIELAGGMLEELDIAEGDLIDLNDLKGLKARAR
ncbi:MAG: DUF192 domain-containing protein [Planctomycetota bacterium]|nr:MAG: DUF192 domain-containing protein [Planctomycetota bacterium]